MGSHVEGAAVPGTASLASPRVSAECSTDRKKVGPLLVLGAHHLGQLCQPRRRGESQNCPEEGSAFALLTEPGRPLPCDLLSGGSTFSLNTIFLCALSGTPSQVPIPTCEVLETLPRGGWLWGHGTRACGAAGDPCCGGNASIPVGPVLKDLKVIAFPPSAKTNRLRRHEIRCKVGSQDKKMTLGGEKSKIQIKREVELMVVHDVGSFVGADAPW